MSPTNGDRPRVALVVDHAGGLSGGVARVVEEMILRCRDEVDFVVVSNTLAEELRPLVEWRRVRQPSGPPARKVPAFLALGGYQVLRADADIIHVHASGPLVPNRVDLLTVHFLRAAWLRW